VTDVMVTGPGGAGSRQISFLRLQARAQRVAPFDPIGRERVRQETINGSASPMTVSAYDAIGRLAMSSRLSGGTPTVQRSFSYDSLVTCPASWISILPAGRPR